MTNHTHALETLRDDLAQHYLDRDQDEADIPRMPLTHLSKISQGYYRALADRLMPVVSTWLAGEASLSWSPTATPCPHMLGDLSCTNTEPHKGDGAGCTHIGAYVTDRHDTTEGVQS